MNASPIIPYFQLWAQSVFGSIGLSNLNTCRGNPGRQMTVGFGCVDQWWMQSSVRLREVVSTVNLYCMSTMLGDLGETKLELVPCGCIVGDSCANRWPKVYHIMLFPEKNKKQTGLFLFGWSIILTVCQQWSFASSLIWSFTIMLHVLYHTCSNY